MADFTVADVLAWARTKPADETYDFTDASQCAVAQFGAATGRNELVGLVTDRLRAHSETLLSAVLADGDREGWTFGALVGRLEALCPQATAPASEWLSIGAYMADIEAVSA